MSAYFQDHGPRADSRDRSGRIEAIDRVQLPELRWQQLIISTG